MSEAITANIEFLESEITRLRAALDKKYRDRQAIAWP